MKRIAPLALIALAIADRAAACAVCFGDPASSQTQALMLAMAVMLGVTTAVLTGIAIVGYRLAGRETATPESSNTARTES